jgi:hypothetical protein
MLEQAKKLIRANPEDPFALGMLAFALHESGAIDAAWDAAVEADAIDPGIAWVHHAFAHIFLSRRQSEVGLKWLARRAPSWRDCGSSMFTHNCKRPVSTDGVRCCLAGLAFREPAASAMAASRRCG